MLSSARCVRPRADRNRSGRRPPAPTPAGSAPGHPACPGRAGPGRPGSAAGHRAARGQFRDGHVDGGAARVSVVERNLDRAADEPGITTGALGQWRARAPGAAEGAATSATVGGAVPSAASSVSQLATVAPATSTARRGSPWRGHFRSPHRDPPSELPESSSLRGFHAGRALVAFVAVTGSRWPRSTGGPEWTRELWRARVTELGSSAAFCGFRSCGCWWGSPVSAGCRR